MEKISRRKFLGWLGGGALGLIAATGYGAKSSSPNLSVAYPPILASIPLKLGDREGVFGARGVGVETVAATGTRDAARLFFQGAVDCCITDVASSVLGFSRVSNEVAITSTAFSPDQNSRYLGLVRNGYREISTVEDLVQNWLDSTTEGSIAIDRGSDYHYMTDRMFHNRGITPKDELFYTPETDMVRAMTNLWNGSIVATVLPEPLLTLSTNNPLVHKKRRAQLLADYEGVEILPSVFTFGTKFLADRPSVVKEFYDGWNEAVEKANSKTKSQMLELAIDVAMSVSPAIRSLLQRVELPQGFAEIFSLPHYSPPGKLDEEMFKGLTAWAKKSGLIEDSPSYSRMVVSTNR